MLALPAQLHLKLDMLSPLINVHTIVLKHTRALKSLSEGLAKPNFSLVKAGVQLFLRGKICVRLKEILLHSYRWALLIVGKYLIGGRPRNTTSVPLLDRV